MVTHFPTCDGYNIRNLHIIRVREIDTHAAQSTRAPYFDCIFFSVHAQYCSVERITVSKDII